MPGVLLLSSRQLLQCAHSQPIPLRFRSTKASTRPTRTCSYFSNPALATIAMQRQTDYKFAINVKAYTRGAGEYTDPLAAPSTADAIDGTLIVNGSFEPQRCDGSTRHLGPMAHVVGSELKQRILGAINDWESNIFDNVINADIRDGLSACRVLRAHIWAGGLSPDVFQVLIVVRCTVTGVRDGASTPYIVDVVINHPEHRIEPAPGATRPMSQADICSFKDMLMEALIVGAVDVRDTLVGGGDFDAQAMNLYGQFFTTPEMQRDGFGTVFQMGFSKTYVAHRVHLTDTTVLCVIRPKTPAGVVQADHIRAHAPMVPTGAIPVEQVNWRAYAMSVCAVRDLVEHTLEPYPIDERWEAYLVDGGADDASTVDADDDDDVHRNIDVVDFEMEE